MINHFSRFSFDYKNSSNGTRTFSLKQSLHFLKVSSLVTSPLLVTRDPFWTLGAEVTINNPRV